MGAAAALVSGAADGRQGTSEAGTQGDAERHLLDRRSGAAWRDLPERYGPWQTVYKRFKEWSESGLIEKIFHELSEDADLQDISIDSTYIKAHKASAGAERGGSQNPPMP